MAVVFRARDERLGRVVALKVLAPVLADDDEFRRRFTREYRLAAAVDDPHIIPVYEAGEAGGVLFIAMRYVAGGDVRSLLRRTVPLPVLQAASIISPVASALDAAHAAGLVHRDVKPANMLLDTRPGRPDHVYLSDFGLSREALSSPGLTSSGLFLGTPDYVSPEQITGRPPNGQADQYSLACTAFELLAGTPPFPRDNGLAVLFAHASESPPLLTTRRPELPVAADAVLVRGMAKDPADRYPTCQEFAESLRAALGLPAYQTHPGAGEGADGEGERSLTLAAHTPTAGSSASQAGTDTMSLVSDPRPTGPDGLPAPAQGPVTGPSPGPGGDSRRTGGSDAHREQGSAAAHSLRRRPSTRAAVIAAACLVISAAVGTAAVLLTAHPAPARGSPKLLTGQSVIPPAGSSSAARQSVGQAPSGTGTPSQGGPPPSQASVPPPSQVSASSAPPSAATVYAAAVNADNPLAYWQFSGRAGPSGYVDSSGNGNSLAVGATTSVSPGALAAPGAISPSAGGTSTTDPLSSFTGDASRTVEAWFQTTSEGCVFNSGSFEDAMAFSLCVENGPYNAPTPGVPGIYFATYDSDVFITMANVMDGNWHYLALSLTGSTVSIIFDGAEPPGYIWHNSSYTGLLSQPFALPDTPDTLATPLGIGTRRPPPHTPTQLVGKLAEVAVYPSAIPVGDLVSHYQLLAG
jgi:serine/threonine protein kinase